MATKGYCILYKGRTYSLHLRCMPELAMALGLNFIEDDTSKDATRCGAHLHSSLSEILTTKISRAVYQIITDTPEHEGSTFSLIYLRDTIEAKCFGERPCYYWRCTEIEDAIQLKEYCDHVSESFLNSAAIVPEAKQDIPLDRMLHEGRVSGKEVLLPIGLYDVRVDHNTGEHVHLNKDDKCTFSVYKILDRSGKIHNSLYRDSRPGPDIATPEEAIDAGHIVYRDTWNGTVSLVEGLLRLKIRFLKTRRLVKPKKSARKKALKLRYDNVECFEREIKHAVEDLYEKNRRIRKILGYDFEIKLKYKRAPHYKGQYIGGFRHTNCHCDEKHIQAAAQRCLGFLEGLKKRERSHVIKYMAADLSLYYNYERIKDQWDRCKVEEVHIFSKFLDKCVKLKAKGATDGTESDSRPTSSEGTTSAVPEARRSVGIVVRTASGYKGLCSRESSAETAGEHTGQHQSAEG